MRVSSPPGRETIPPGTSDGLGVGGGVPVGEHCVR